MSGKPGRWRPLWSQAAVIALNALLLFIALNLVTALALSRVDEAAEKGALAYGLERLAPLYPELGPEQIEALLRETASRRYVYEPFTQFKEDAYGGEHLNVSDQGFRLTVPAAPWPPDRGRLNVFLFGGSTAFGYGQPDRATLASVLIRRLLDGGCTVSVYNFARSNYYSTQERILFEQLLLAGFRPDLALFVDGINEFQHPRDEPKFTARLSYLMAEDGYRLARRAAGSLPLVRWVRRGLQQRDRGLGGRDEPDAARALVERWLRNRRMIRALAADFEVKTLFVWQPSPSFRYDLRHHPFAEPGGGNLPGHLTMERGYRILEERLEREGPLPDLLWLADLQSQRREALYVDRFHYSAAFTAELAERIAAAARPLLCPEPPDADGDGP